MSDFRTIPACDDLCVLLANALPDWSGHHNEFSFVPHAHDGRRLYGLGREIAHTWAVVEAMTRHGWELGLYQDGKLWIAGFDQGDQSGVGPEVSAETPSLAICRAALGALDPQRKRTADCDTCGEDGSPTGGPHRQTPWQVRHGRCGPGPIRHA